jgi:hypothetical protein
MEPACYDHLLVVQVCVCGIHITGLFFVKIAKKNKNYNCI